jgi:hypothetical protein
MAACVLAAIYGIWVLVLEGSLALLVAVQLILLAVIPAVAQSLHLLVAGVVAGVLCAVACIKAALARLVAVAFVCAATLGALTTPPAPVGFLHLVLAFLAT